MEFFSAQPDRIDQVLASDLDSLQAGDLRDWFCYTKPLGGDVKLIARPLTKTDPAFCVHTAGNDAKSARK